MKKVRVVLSTLAFGAAFVGAYASVASNNAATLLRFYEGTSNTGPGGTPVAACVQANVDSACTLTVATNATRCSITTDVTEFAFKQVGSTPSCAIPIYRPI